MEDNFILNNTTSKLLYAIYEQLNQINSKLDKIIADNPKENSKIKVKKDVK